MDGRNIFVAGRFDDRTVGPCEQVREAVTAEDYARYLIRKVRHAGDGFSFYGYRMYEDIDTLDQEGIDGILEYRLFYTDVTVVLVSPEMVDPGRTESGQWASQIIRFSLNGRRASRGPDSENAVIAVLLPGRDGTYDYAVCRDEAGYGLKTDCMFEIMRRNMFNRTDPPSKTRFKCCINTGESCYIPVQTWDYFICNFVKSMAQAVRTQSKHAIYDIARDFADGQ